MQSYASQGFFEQEPGWLVGLLYQRVWGSTCQERHVDHVQRLISCNSSCIERERETRIGMRKWENTNMLCTLLTFPSPTSGQRWPKAGACGTSLAIYFVCPAAGRGSLRCSPTDLQDVQKTRVLVQFTRKGARVRCWMTPIGRASFHCWNEHLERWLVDVPASHDIKTSTYHSISFTGPSLFWCSSEL